MKPRIRGIRIPRPCTENWESMDRAEGQERYCSQCAHCVTDFTVLRDREVVEQLRAREGRICGRFTRDQLDRVNLSLRPEPQPSTWRSALLALPAPVLSGEVIPVRSTSRSVYERLWRPLRLLEDRWKRPERSRDIAGPFSPRPEG